MRNLFFSIIILLLLVFGLPFEAFAAEVLQVTSSSILLVGDHNRTYTVKLMCVDVPPEKEELALNWLRSELPRHTRVNLRPKGSKEGVLLASVFTLENDIDINEKLKEKGLAGNNC